jgi:hypothetical protein
MGLTIRTEGTGSFRSTGSASGRARKCGDERQRDRADIMIA